MNKRHLALAAFIAANIAARMLASSEPALSASDYEPATDAEIAAALADHPIVCVAADTESGCR